MHTKYIEPMQDGENQFVKTNVQIFHTTDERLKSLGEIFANESSRKILALLLEKDMTIMDVSKESGISPNLVMHHLKKMISSDVVVVTKESKNSRGHALRFYRAKQTIVILTNDKAQHAKPLKNMLGKIARFGAIGITGTFTWIVTNSHHALESALKYPRPTLPPYMAPIEAQASYSFLFPVLVTAAVIAAGIAINHYLPKISKS